MGAKPLGVRVPPPASFGLTLDFPAGGSRRTQEARGLVGRQAFVVIGTPEEAVAEVRRRYGDLATCVTLPLSEDIDPLRRSSLLKSLRTPASGAVV